MPPGLCLAEVDQLRTNGKPARLGCAVENSNHKPRGSRVLCPGLQADQQKETKGNAKPWNERIQKKPARQKRLRRKPKMHQSRQINAHESQERAKRYDLRSVLPWDCDYANISDNAYDPHVVDRIALLGTEIAEYLLRQHVIASHAVEKP